MHVEFNLDVYHFTHNVLRLHHREENIFSRRGVQEEGKISLLLLNPHPF
jgi:hypothetical protein